MATKMRIMKNLRNYFLAILIIGVGIAAIACSSDDEPKKDETVFDNDPPQDFDGLTVTYQLLNKDSIPMKSFKQGEDIIFSLIIKNNRDTTVSLPLIREIVDENLFTVYKSTGEKCGKPWKELYEWGLVSIRPRLVSQHYLTIETPWVKGQSKPDEVFSEWGNNDPLPAGSYYTQFDIHIFKDSDKTITCRKEFVIE